MFGFKKKKTADSLEEALAAIKRQDAQANKNAFAPRFSMKIVDVFSITGRGTVVTGKVDTGSIKVGDAVEIATQNGNIQSKVLGIEIFGMIKSLEAGDNAGLLLSHVKKEDVKRGDVIRGI